MTPLFGGGPICDRAIEQRRRWAGVPVLCGALLGLATVLGGRFLRRSATERDGEARRSRTSSRATRALIAVGGATTIACLAWGCSLLVSRTHRTYVLPVDPEQEIGPIPEPPHITTYDCGSAVKPIPRPMEYPVPWTFVYHPCRGVVGEQRRRAAEPLGAGLLLGMATILADRRRTRPSPDAATAPE